MKTRLPLVEILRDFGAVAARRRLRWYLFGAQAVALYGVQRTSADVDITAEIAATALRPFIADMRRGGFESRIDDDAFVEATRVIPMIHRATTWPVDVVLSGPGLEERFLDGVSRKKVEGVDVPVIAPAHLIVTKILAGRPKDLEDVRGLLRQAKQPFDLDEVRETLTLVQEALDQSDLVPLFERLVAEVE